jgi:GLPGLI family protein
MKRLVYTLFLIFGLNQLYFVQAQNLVLTGVITFEKKENMHKQFTEENSWNAEWRKNMPKYKVDEFELKFSPSQTLYKVTKEDESPYFSWSKVAANNTVKMIFESKKYEAEKTIYEKNYRIKDSIPQYDWKFSGEYRTIAGFNCRKATTIILDSIYVIAFYTDEIPVAGGPESFTGLPGMVLGVVLPRLNITYFATKVEGQIVAETAFDLPKTKSKVTSFMAFKDELNKALKDWGEYATKVLWKANL